MTHRSHQREHAASFSANDALAATRVCSVGGLLGESAAMQTLFEQIARAAASQDSVLFVGERGSGKELAARCLHTLSSRSMQPLLVFNCGAQAAALTEAELFGREAGTGSDPNVKHLVSQQGYLERAGEGTLLLEEVHQLSADMQLKLLRVLESGRVMRIGAQQDFALRCRILATIEQQSDAELLRRELLDRLSVSTVAVAPLRERGDDAELLAHYFLAVLNAEEATAKRFSARSIECLRRYSWPGNVRELRNAVHRAFILADSDLDLAVAIERPLALSSDGDAQVLRIPVGTSLAEAERWMILATLRKCQGNKTRAAALLGVSLKTLYNRLNAYRAQGLDESDLNPQLFEVAN
jgi:DNA-binding NtrC family response regulator